MVPAPKYRSPSAAWASALALTMVLCLAGGSSIAQTGDQPWEIPAGKRVKDVERESRAAAYWYEQYLGAKDLLEGRIRPDAAKLAQAVDWLRLAILQQSASKKDARHPTENYDFPYAPYYLLARAFEQLGEFESAGKCLDRENGSVLSGEDLRNFESLRTRLTDLREAQQYVRIAKRIANSNIRGWASPEGIAELDKIRNLAEQIEAGRVAQNGSRLATAVSDLVRIESGRLKGRLQTLDSTDWRSVFADEGRDADPDKCSVTLPSETSAALDSALDALTDCADETRQAARQAGRKACAKLQGLRGEIQHELDLEKELIEGAAPPELPPQCPALCESTDWSQLELANGLEVLDELGFAERNRVFREHLTLVQARVNGRRVQFETMLKNQKARIIVVSPDCATTLRCTGANSDLLDLRSTIDNTVSGIIPFSRDLFDIGSDIDMGLARLQSSVDQRVTGLLAQKGTLDGVDTSRFERLPGARDAFVRERTQQNLDALCTAAGSAQEAINAWGRDRLPVLREKLNGYRWIMDIAGRWRATEEDGRLSCIEDSLERWPGSAAGADQSGWANRASEAISLAQACMAEYREAHDIWANRIRNGIELATNSLRSIDGGLSLEPIEPIRQRLGEANRTLDGLAPLLQLSGEITVASVRQALEGSGLQISRERWDDVDALGEGEVSEGLLAIRDEAVQAALSAAAREFEIWRPVQAKLEPFLALDAAFSSFVSGDVDAAILSLRRWDGRAEGNPKVTALRHAALSYFLFTKRQLLAEDGREGEVGRFLLEDAQQEARAAIAQQGFEMPVSLLSGSGFRKFFEDCKSM